MALLYYRSYITQRFISSCLFEVDHSTVSRIIQKLEPLLAKAMPLPKERSLSQEEVMCLIDATEQSIERPSKGQQGYYSGKKKRHTIKTGLGREYHSKID